MKKMLLIALPVAVVLVLVATLSFGLGRGHGHHGMMKDFLFYKIDRVSQELNLNPSQQARWDTFKKDLETTIDQRKGMRRQIHEAFEKELYKDNPDFTALTPTLHTQIDSTAQFAHDMVNRVNELLGDLTPDQKKKLSQIVIEKMREHE